MRDIAIIGAGDLGGAAAHVLARRNAAGTIRLVDERGRVAEGKALDIMQAAPIEGFAAVVSGSTDLVTAGGAAVVVVADRVGGAEWQGEDGLMLLKRLLQVAPRAVIVCAGAAQRELVDRGVRELHISRRRLFGTAPEALANAARAVVALAVDGSPRDVMLTVAGAPPHHLVLPWDDASVGGFAATKVIDEVTRRQLTARVAALWPPGPYALASACAKAAEAMAGRTRTILSCFVGPDDAAGRRARATALPVRLQRDGIATVVLPELSAVDRVVLENAMML